MKDFLLSDPRTIGTTIKCLRSEMNITQEELASYTGLSRIGVVKLEKEGNDLKLLGLEVVLRKRSNK